MKTIDIHAKEWFDKANGNSYFSALVVVDYGMDSEKTIKIPFQYGYGDHYLHVAHDAIAKEYGIDSRPALSALCRESGVILRTIKETNCKQRDCKQFVA